MKRLLICASVMCAVVFATAPPARASSLGGDGGDFSSLLANYLMSENPEEVFVYVSDANVVSSFMGHIYLNDGAENLSSTSQFELGEGQIKFVVGADDTWTPGGQYATLTSDMMGNVSSLAAPGANLNNSLVLLSYLFDLDTVVQAVQSGDVKLFVEGGDGGGGGGGGEPVPEPATMLLLGAGMAGLAAARKRA